MNTTKYTFWDILNQEHKIEIPIIQRDYAQGRKTEKVTAIRNGILDNLFEAIKNEKSLDFDFIYGSLNDGSFIPLDGQQRLTTLFLLHWYLAAKDGKIENAKLLLKKFTYETRISSREFCSALVTHGIDLPDHGTTLSSIIEDKPWFFISWKKDPTIQSMIVMLDAIHAKFYHTTGFFDVLTDPTKSLVSFQFIKIDNFGLTDSLYIKMNARGKELTDFENFKAKFEYYLEKNHPLKKIEFAQKIDGVWTDFFWKHKDNFLVDVPFMRFFNFISEMLYYQNFSIEEKEFSKAPDMRFELIEKLYLKSENVDFLFATLDLLETIEDTTEFFDLIFSKNEYQTGKVALFEENVNLFNNCIKGEGFDIKNKILFFIILRNLIQNNKTDVDENLLDRIRVVRNLILRVRQRIHTEITSNLRYNDLPKQLQELIKLLDRNENIYEVLNSGIELSTFKESLEEEREKAVLIITEPSLKNSIHALEDQNILRGAIYNLDIKINFKELPTFVSSLNSIWSIDDDSLIVRSMLAIEDYAMNIGYCALGNRYFFGNKNRWLTVLTNLGENADLIKKLLPNFLRKFNEAIGDSPKLKLQTLIDAYLVSEPKKDWRYYFIKYPQMTSENNLYAWVNDYELRSLNRNTLLGYHINPYVRTVARLINDTAICFINYCYSQYDVKSPLKLMNNVMLYSIEDGWRIELPEDVTLSDDLKSFFNLECIPDSNDYLLKENSLADRIEIAVAFANKIIIK